MRISFIGAACSALAAYAILTACSGDPLNYEQAMSLLKDRNSEPVKITFSATPRISPASDARITRAYDRLMEEHVLACENTPALGMVCQPGPAGEELTPAGSADLALVAGRWTPAVITHIARTGRSSASADIRMAFEPTSLFREFENELELIQNSVGTRLELGDRKDGKMARATFQRYEDGWRLESLE
jgi:hypothetical protein